MALALAFFVFTHIAAVESARCSSESAGSGAGADAAWSWEFLADGQSEFDTDDGLNDGLSLWSVPRGSRVKPMGREGAGIAELLRDGDNELEIHRQSLQFGRKQLFGNGSLHTYRLSRAERCKPRPPPLGDTIVVRNLGPNVTDRDLMRASYPGVTAVSVDFWDPNRFNSDDFLIHMLSHREIPENRSAHLRFNSDGDAEIAEGNLRKAFGEDDVERLPKPERYFADHTLLLDTLAGADGETCWTDIAGARLSECRASEPIGGMTLFLCLRRHEEDKMVAFLADLSSSGGSWISKFADLERAPAYSVFRVPAWSRAGSEGGAPLEGKLRSGNARLRFDLHWRKSMLRTLVPNSRGPPGTQTFLLQKLPNCERGLEGPGKQVRGPTQRTSSQADLSLEVEGGGPFWKRTKDILCWRSSVLRSCFLGVADSERRLFCCNTDPADEVPTEVLLADDDGVRIADLVLDEFATIGNMLLSQCDSTRVEGHGDGPVDFLHTNLPDVKPYSKRQFCWRNAHKADGLDATSCWRGHDPSFVSLLPLSVSMLYRGALVFCLFEADDPHLDRIKVFVPKDYDDQTAAPNSWRRLKRVKALGAFVRRSAAIGVEVQDPWLGWESGWREEPGTFDRSWSTWLVSKLLPP